MPRWERSPRPPDLLRSSPLRGGQLEDKRDAGTARAGERLHLVRDPPRYPKAVAGQFRKWPARPRDPRMRSGRRRRPGSAVPPPDARPAVARSRRHGRPHWPPARERPGPHPRPGHQPVPPDRQEPAPRSARYAARPSRTPGQEAAGHRPHPRHLPDRYRPFAAGILVYAKRVIDDDRPALEVQLTYAPSKRVGSAHNHDRSRAQPIFTGYATARPKRRDRHDSPTSSAWR